MQEFMVLIDKSNHFALGSVIRFKDPKVLKCCLFTFKGLAEKHVNIQTKVLYSL